MIIRGENPLAVMLKSVLGIELKGEAVGTSFPYTGMSQNSTLGLFIQPSATA